MPDIILATELDQRVRAVLDAYEGAELAYVQHDAQKLQELATYFRRIEPLSLGWIDPRRERDRSMVLGAISDCLARAPGRPIEAVLDAVVLLAAEEAA